MDSPICARPDIGPRNSGIIRRREINADAGTFAVIGIDNGMAAASHRILTTFYDRREPLRPLPLRRVVVLRAAACCLCACDSFTGNK